MEDHADVLLVTVTRVETVAVLDAFQAGTGQPARLVPLGNKTYHDLGTVNGARIWLVRSEMGAGGLGASQQTVTKAIEALRPGAVIMVGIAFGIDATWEKIGDILVSEGLRAYELQRVGTERIIPRGSRPDASPWLLDAFKSADLSWKGAPVRFGLILTGEKLVDNHDFRGHLLSIEPEAIGGEMEGAGLYTACQDAKVDWILVKAICDWADGEKEVDRQPRQALAAKNAAEFVLHTLTKVSLKRQRESQAEHDPSQPEARSGIVATQSGSGGMAIGPGAVAVGKGGMAVGGDMHASVQVGTSKRRKPKS